MTYSRAPILLSNAPMKNEEISRNYTVFFLFISFILFMLFIPHVHNRFYG